MARSELVGFAHETRDAMIEPNQPGRDPDRAWVRMSIAMFAVIGLAARQPRSETIGSGAASTTMPTKASAAPASKQAATRDPGLMGVVKSVFDRFGRDNISLVAAGIAFYVLAALFPSSGDACLDLRSFRGPSSGGSTRQRLRRHASSRSFEDHHRWDRQLRSKNQDPSCPWHFWSASSWPSGAPGQE